MDERQTLKKKILEQIQKFRLMDDDFLTKVFEDPACTQLFLEIVLDRNDITVHTPITQREIKNLQGRSVKLDVYVTDEAGKTYNIEIQRSDLGAVPQRARYYSGLIDANITLPGDHYENLPETYVIFVTENDVLGGGLPLYHIERRIAETGELFDDKSHILYVNSQIQDDTKLGRLMRDFYCTNADDMHYSVLANRVRYFKEDEGGVTTMCRAVEELCKEERQNGEEIGRKEEKKDIVIKMLKSGMPYEQIASFTDLSVEEIEKIDKERK